MDWWLTGWLSATLIFHNTADVVYFGGGGKKWELFLLCFFMTCKLVGQSGAISPNHYVIFVLRFTECFMMFISISHHPLGQPRSPPLDLSFSPKSFMLKICSFFKYMKFFFIMDFFV